MSRSARDALRDDTVRVRLDRVCSEPLPAAGESGRKQLAELDQLAESMIGRSSTDETAMKEAIQTEVLRRGPDRALPTAGRSPDLH